MAAVATFQLVYEYAWKNNLYKVPVVKKIILPAVISWPPPKASAGRHGVWDQQQNQGPLRIQRRLVYLIITRYLCL